MLLHESNGDRLSLREHELTGLYNTGVFDNECEEQEDYVPLQDRRTGVVPFNTDVLEYALSKKLFKSDLHVMESEVRRMSESDKHFLQVWVDRVIWNQRKQFTFRRKIILITVVIWAIVLWGALFYKASTEKWLDIFEYYTNLSFLFQAVYYTVYLFVFTENPYRRKLETIVTVGFGFVLFSQVCLVFFMVLGVLKTAPELLTNEMKIGGGEYDDGDVLVVERVFHVFPAFVALVFVALTAPDMADCLIQTFGYVKILYRPEPEKSQRFVPVFLSNRPTYENDATSGEDVLNVAKMTVKEKILSKPHARVFVERKVLIFYIIAEYTLSCLPFIFYMLVVDLQEQYHVPGYLSTWAPLITVFALNLFFVVLPVLYMYSVLQSRFVVSDVYKLIAEYVRTIDRGHQLNYHHIDTDGKAKIFLRSIPGLTLPPI